MAVFCPQCGTASEDSRRPCLSCQALLLAAEVTVLTGRRCDDCGRQVLGNALFCHGCGSELTLQATPAPVAPLQRQRALAGVAAAIVALVGALLLAGIPLRHHRSAVAVTGAWRLESLTPVPQTVRSGEMLPGTVMLTLGDDGRFVLAVAGGQLAEWRGVWRSRGPLLQMEVDDAETLAAAPTWVASLLSGQDAHCALERGGSWLKLTFVPRADSDLQPFGSRWRRLPSIADTQR